jgi:hypothetical protein
MHGLELFVVGTQKPSGFGHAVRFCLELVVAIAQIADFKVLGSERSPEPPYFANQSGTILNTERPLPVDVLLKLIQSFDFHGALSLFESGILPTPDNLGHITTDAHSPSINERQQIWEFHVYSGVTGFFSLSARLMTYGGQKHLVNRGCQMVRYERLRASRIALQSVAHSESFSFSIRYENWKCHDQDASFR